MAASPAEMPPLPHTLLAKLTYALFSIICVFALWKGDRLQKLTAGLLLVVTAITPLIQDRVHWMDPGARFMIVDCVLLLFFLALAVTVGRAWMIIAAAFQLLSTLSHPAAHFAYKVTPYAYIFIFQLFSYGVYLTLGISVFADLVRRMKIGAATAAIL